MKQRQGGFLISKIKQIGGRRFDKILQENKDDAHRHARKNAGTGTYPDGRERERQAQRTCMPD